KGIVTVTVLSTTLERTPVVGAPVVFDDVDGTVTEIATDASGKAHADVARGASVTAVYVLSTTAQELQTVLNVAPGDDLTIAPNTTSSTVWNSCAVVERT